jgi:hypothetical protein
MEWMKLSEYNLPPQGLKILCFRSGDVWISRRFRYKNKDYWLEIAYEGGSSILTDPPDYWMKLELLEGCTGLMQIALDGDKNRLASIDEWQSLDPESHEEFVCMIIERAENRCTR